MDIIRKNYTLSVEEPVIYVDNESRMRSGHMTHAMAQFAPGQFIDFNSNCSALRLGGHYPYGWIEYRISKDSGKTYSEINDLKYSVDSFLDGIYAISIEKAVGCDNGTVVAFCLRNDALSQTFCEPWATPTVITTQDEGKTWSEPVELCPYAGRIYDACYHQGKIYVLIFCNAHFLGETEEHKYRIYKSSDNGNRFEELCVVPIDGLGRGYGSMQFDHDGNLHVYAYNNNCETEMDHAISKDGGHTWERKAPCFLSKGIRNPQTAILDGVWILHGRSMSRQGFVIYTSPDGDTWDEGFLLENNNFIAGAYYSNNLNLRDEQGNFLLVQYSSPYTDKKDPYYVGTVNVKHTVLRITK